MHPPSEAGTLETRSQMKVGEETYTAGDAGPWGTIMAVQHTPKH